MGKSNRQTAENQNKQNYDTTTQQGAATQTQLQGMLGDAQTRTTGTYNDASGAYKGMLGGTGSYDPAEYAKVSAQNQSNIDTGGYDPGRLSQLRDTNVQNVQTGGYNPTDVANVNKGYSNLTANGTGGLDPTQLAKMRSGYGNLADTGGIDESTADAMRRQSASGVQSVYSTMGQNLARQQKAQGFGGGGGETAEMARQAANTQGTAITGVNAEIGKLRQTGTIAGLGGLSNVESGAAAGQREAVAGEAGFAGAQAGNKLAAQNTAQNLETSKATNTLSASQANQELATGAAQQKIQAAGGLANLYSANPGYVTSMVQAILQSQATTGQLTNEQNQIMQEISKQPGVFSTMMGTLAQLGGAAGGVMTGIGSL